MSQKQSFRPRTELLEVRETPAASPIYAVGSGPAAGSIPRVQVYNSTSGQLVGDFVAFESTFTGGVTTAIGDVNNDAIGDLIIAAGNGGGPRVRVIDGRAFVRTSTVPLAPLDGKSNINEANVIADFFAFEASQRGGSYVSTGNFVGAAFSELVVGAGPGGGPRVRIYDGQQVSKQGRQFTGERAGDAVANFFAFESTFRNGVTVTANPSPISGLSVSDLVVAPGIGGAPRVRVLSGTQIAQRQLQFSGTLPGETIADFFAGNSAARQGVYIASADFNRDGFADVAVGTGPGTAGAVTIYNGVSIRGGNFTGAAAGDVLTSFTIDNYSNGVTLGTAIQPAALDTGLLIVGTGGAGRRSQHQVISFAPGAGFLQQNLLFNTTFDPNFIGGVFVSS